MFVVSSILCVIATSMTENTSELRNKLHKQELAMMLGSDIKLSDSEMKANEIIMKLKIKELDQAFRQQNFSLTKHFFEYKDEVRDTELFKLLQRMPKGALLHVHDTGTMNSDYLLKLTYMADLYVCFNEQNVDFLFSKEIPRASCNGEWQLLRDARLSTDVDKFDADLKKHFTLVVHNPKDDYTDTSTVWKKFEQYFMTTAPILQYKPVWEQYFYDTLKTFRDDNIMYVEIRSGLPNLYDLEGHTYDSVKTAQTYKEVLDRFMKDYPDFYGAKLIYAPTRVVDNKMIKEYLGIVKEIKEKVPGFLAGFDLVGQEDVRVPIKEITPELEGTTELDYFFHAGETNWYGTSSDENLLDAVALNCKRIGHAFALMKHPVLVEEVKKRDIALEVNVISNLVLKLVDDVRNHPLAAFLAQGLPVVLSSDDPGVWEADPLTHDFYVAFLGVASKHADLKMLKKLALNSLNYSTYPNKDKIVHEFEIRWTKFIDSVVNGKKMDI